MDAKQAGLTEEKLRALMKQCNKCPKCNEICLEDFPVVQCTADHRLCKTCFLASLNEPCFQCNKKENNKKGPKQPKPKNECPKVKCSYASEGCKVLKNKDKIKYHEGACNFKPQECLGKLTDTFGCGWSGNYNALPSHFAEKHPLNWNNMSYKHEAAIIANQYKNLQLFKSHNKHFLYLYKHIKESNKAYFYIALLGPPEEAKKFCYEMAFFIPDDPVSLIKFREICLPANTPSQDIFNNEKCIVLGDALRLRYTYKNKLHYRFWIKTTDVFSSKPEEEARAKLKCVD